MSRLCALHAHRKDMIMTTVTVLHNVDIFLVIFFFFFTRIYPIDFLFIGHYMNKKLELISN